MNLPNKLTVFRIILVPIFIIVGYLGMLGIITGEILWGIPIYMIIMGLIFGIAALTDKFDGTLARKYNLVTNFGKFLDPIADKILVLTAMVMFVELGKLPAWIPIIVLFREFAVSGFRLIAVEQGGRVISASKWGKLKTATQMIAISLMFIDKNGFFDFIFRQKEFHPEFSGIQVIMTTPEFVLNIVVSVIMLVSVIACIFSGIDYLKGGKEYLKDA